MSTSVAAFVHLITLLPIRGSLQFNIISFYSCDRTMTNDTAVRSPYDSPTLWHIFGIRRQPRAKSNYNFTLNPTVYGEEDVNFGNIMMNL